MPNPAQGSNTPRLRLQHLDFIRLIAMLLMIQGHTLDALLRPEHVNLELFHWKVWLGLRGLTAPMFLMLSGAASVLGIRHDADGRVAQDLVQRRVRLALSVIGIGYLMVFPANSLADLSYVPANSWRSFLQVNILQINGVTLLLLTALLCRVRTVRRYAAWSLALGTAILLVAPFTQRVDWFRWLPEALAAFLSFEHGSLFPIFPASAYMCLGIGLGALMVETPEESRVRVFRMTSLVGGGLVLLLSLAVDRLPASLLPAHDAYKLGYAFTGMRVGFSLLIFGFLSWFAEAHPRIVAGCAPLGRKSLAVYVLHIVLLYGTPWTPGLATARYHTSALSEGLLYIPLVGGLTLAGILAWDWIHRRSSAIGALLHVSAAFALAYALVF